MSSIQCPLSQEQFSLNQSIFYLVIYSYNRSFALLFLQSLFSQGQVTYTANAGYVITEGPGGGPVAIPMQDGGGGMVAVQRVTTRSQGSQTQMVTDLFLWQSVIHLNWPKSLQREP